MRKIGFYKITLDLDQNLFNEFMTSISFEVTGKGRLGNHLVREDERGIPLVRTTTSYNEPSYYYSIRHKMLADKIAKSFKEIGEENLHFNNALIEVYNQDYRKMKYHSDQCLDIKKGSYIALFSCYEKPEELTEHSIRKLKWIDKATEQESELSLTHNSVILFSTLTNSRFLHKIVLDPVKGMKPPETENRWLGITFRESNNFIQFRDGAPYFLNGIRLKITDDELRKEFFRLRSEENRNSDFKYPDFYYTISPADLLQPLKPKQ